MEKKLVYIDTDISLGTPGAEIDDGAALIALLQSPQVEIIGIGTVHGNVPVDDATQNLLRLLSLFGIKNIPVGIGASLPLIENKSWFVQWQAGYERTPRWRVDKALPSAANLLIDLIRSSSRKINILAIGPLTNIALALRLAPDLTNKIKRVITMGGSSIHKNSVAEFNIHCDPEAAQMVFSSGLPLRLLGLEITKQIVFSREDFACLPDSNPAVHLLKYHSTGWIDRVEHAGWEKDGCALHDAVAAVALIHEDLFQFQKLDVSVELFMNKRRGVTLFKKPGAGEKSLPIEVAIHVDAAKCKAWILSALKA
jgi:inosine-uridine nucleoside N-ribohydrolase